IDSPLKKCLKRIKQVCTQCAKAAACVCFTVGRGFKKCWKWMKRVVGVKRKSAKEVPFALWYKVREEERPASSTPDMEPLEELLLLKLIERNKGQATYGSLEDLKKELEEEMRIILEKEEKVFLAKEEAIKKHQEYGYHEAHLFYKYRLRDAQQWCDLEEGEEDPEDMTPEEIAELEPKLISEYRRLEEKAFVEYSASLLKIDADISAQREKTLSESVEQIEAQTSMFKAIRAAAHCDKASWIVPVSEPVSVYSSSQEAYILPPKRCTKKGKNGAQCYATIMGATKPTPAAAMCMEYLPVLKHAYNRGIAAQLKKISFPENVPQEQKRAKKLSLILQKEAERMSVLICEHTQKVFFERIERVVLQACSIKVAQIREKLFDSADSFARPSPKRSTPFSLSDVCFEAYMKPQQSASEESGKSAGKVDIKPMQKDIPGPIDPSLPAETDEEVCVKASSEEQTTEYVSAS
ncbi:hypothetical protein NEFER03_2269, partial [Nematocida sp. LUAm3]